MQAIISKIQKLLALSGNNPNENERNRAMEKAMEMAAEHNLDIEEVQEKDLSGKPESCIDESINLEPWTRRLMFAVCKLYYTSYYIRRKDVKNFPVIIGTRSNIQITLDIFKWLADNIRKESNKLYKEQALRKSFRLGASMRLYERALALLETEKFKGEAKGTSLVVLRSRLETVNDQFLESLKLKNIQSRSSLINQTAYQKGRAYGEGVGLNRQIH